jgi:hypothetical protein
MTRDRRNGAQVIVSRDGGFWRDRFRTYRVRIDGRVVGKVREFEVLTVPVAPGIHEVQVSLDWGTSPRVIVNVDEDGVQYLKCGPGSVLGLLVPGMYLDLHPVSGSDRESTETSAD